jgi:hypothetical protein
MDRSSPSLGVAYFGNRYPHHARADLAEITATGASFVVHTMSEADLRWNPDTMRDLVEAGQEVGLSAWITPWALGGVFGGEAPSYAVMEHPDACQRDNHGRPLPALCPRRPAFRQLIEAWLDAVAASGAEICQWDEPHLALGRRSDDARWACRCEACEEAFRQETERPMPVEASEEVDSFVQRLLSETVIWLVEAAHRRGLGSSIVLLPDERAGTDDWPRLAALPGVRYFGVTPYWVFEGIAAEEMPAYLRGWCERLVAATAGTAAEPLGWIQAFALPAGREAEIPAGVAIMRATGIRSIAVWAFRACEAMSALAPDDPDLVWATVKRAFSEAREWQT